MNLSPPTLTDYPIRTSEKLRFADTDRNGHITNSVFAVCCQNARMELLCDPRRVPIPSGTQFVVARLLLEFRAEMHWPGTVEVGTRFDRIGRSSVSLDQALFVGDDCVATCHSVVVLIDASTRRPTPLPPRVIEALQPIAWVNGSASVTPARLRTHSARELSMETARWPRNRITPSEAMPPTAPHDRHR
jgi:acyl-CoA thioester hydrolase